MRVVGGRWDNLPEHFCYLDNARSVILSDLSINLAAGKDLFHLWRNDAVRQPDIRLSGSRVTWAGAGKFLGVPGVGVPFGFQTVHNAFVYPPASSVTIDDRLLDAANGNVWDNNLITRS